MASTGPAPILNLANLSFTQNEIKVFKPLAARLVTENAAMKLTMPQIQEALKGAFPKFLAYLKVCQARQAQLAAQAGATVKGCDEEIAALDQQVDDSRESAVRKAIGGL